MRSVFPKPHQPVGIAKWKGPHQDAIDGREDGGVCADAERNCNCGRQRKRRRAPEHSQRITDILAKKRAVLADRGEERVRNHLQPKQKQ